MYEEKTKALINCTVTMQLICAFVFAYAKSRFSLAAAQLILYYLRSFFLFLVHSFYFKIKSVSGLFEMSLAVRKPVFAVSDQVRHKPGCTAIEDG